LNGAAAAVSASFDGGDWGDGTRAVARAQAKQEIAVLKIMDKLLNKGRCSTKAKARPGARECGARIVEKG
jgi:hypothetical protein